VTSKSIAAWLSLHGAAFSRTSRVGVCFGAAVVDADSVRIALSFGLHGNERAAP
jgi:hypothetical protein